MTEAEVAALQDGDRVAVRAGDHEVELEALRMPGAIVLGWGTHQQRIYDLDGRALDYGDDEHVQPVRRAS
jgi:hypothetical protein